MAFCCGQLDDYDTEAESDAAWKGRVRSQANGEVATGQPHTLILTDDSMEPVARKIIAATNRPPPKGMS